MLEGPALPQPATKGVSKAHTPLPRHPCAPSSRRSRKSTGRSISCHGSWRTIAPSSGIPDHDHLDLVSSDLGSALPRELRADGVIKLTRGGEPALALVVEVQLGIDPDKRLTWPAYLVGARLTHRCDVVLIVLTADRDVAAWARKPIELGPGTGTVRTLVLAGPGVTFAEAHARRILAPLAGMKLPFLGRRELLRNKATAGRPKDLADLAMLAEVAE